MMQTEQTLNQNRSLIYVIGTAMELCWMQAWFEFLMHSILHQRASLGFLPYIYLGGAIVHRICYSRQRLRVVIIVVQFLTFFGFCLSATQLFIMPAGQLTSVLHPPQLSLDPNTVQQWLVLTVSLATTAIAWNRSRLSIVKPLSLENVYLRFDLGLAGFFVLLVIKLLLVARFGIILPDPNLKVFLLAFIICGLLVIGLILNSNNINSGLANGLQKIGVATGFSVVVLAAVIGFVALFHSQIVVSAETLSSTLKKAGPPLMGVIGWLVRLMWMPRRDQSPSHTSSENSQSTYQSILGGPMEPGWFLIVLKWGIIALLSALLLFCCYWLLRLLLRFLLTKTEAVARKSDNPLWWFSWLDLIWKGLVRWFNPANLLPRSIETAADLHAVLLKWGRKSGVAIGPDETLNEYGNRLTLYFAPLADSINLIIHLIHQDAYREVTLSPQQIQTGKQAKREMHHPRFWKSRFHMWFVSPKSRSRLM